VLSCQVTQRRWIAHLHLIGVEFSREQRRVAGFEGEILDLPANQASVNVVISELSDKNVIVRYLINDTMFIGYASGPIARQAMFQSLGLSQPLEWGTLNILDERIYSLENGFVGFLPIQIVIPAIGRKYQVHSLSSRAVPFPASNSEMDSSKRLALAGDRSRYAVSSMA
jgi:hypothetical protein